MISVVHPGFLTSVQDLGRFGLQRYGVIVSGAMDTVALRVGNILVGNDRSAACLEMTLVGPELEFSDDSLIAVTGGGMLPEMNGVPVPALRPVFVKAGSTLKFVPQAQGCRSYLAVAGGIAVPSVMGSASTYLKAGVGGFHGRALEVGDRLEIGSPSELGLKLQRKLQSENPFTAASWSVSPDVFPYYQPSPTLRVMWGPQKDLFTPMSLDNFQKQSFSVTSQSDRMGYRLRGPKLELSSAHELISEAVTAGTIQVPPEGNPIVLMADHQTTGGYPQLGILATVDMPVLAQVRPGGAVRFEVVSISQAQFELRQQEEEILAFELGMKVFEG